jgi:uncharacterized protein with WD repeat
MASYRSSLSSTSVSSSVEGLAMSCRSFEILDDYCTEFWDPYPSEFPIMLTMNAFMSVFDVDWELRVLLEKSLKITTLFSKNELLSALKWSSWSMYC